MADSIIKQADRYRERIRNQNQAAKANWDTVSCRLPKGTKDIIRERGESVNGLINRLILEWIENNGQNASSLTNARETSNR